MTVGASVTWTHCSVLFEVTWGKTRRVRTDAHVRDSVRTHLPPLPSPSLPFPPLPSPSLPFPPLPSPLSLPPLCYPRGREFLFLFFIVIFYLKKIFFLVVVAGLEREKKFTIYNFRFSIPEIPEIPELRGLHGRSREKKKVFLA
jgi:hypothetical protein